MKANNYLIALNNHLTSVLVSSPALAVIKNYKPEVNRCYSVNLLRMKRKFMKIIIIGKALLLSVIEGAFAQQINSAPVLTRDAYMKISENQRQGSILLVVLGCTIGLVGGVISVAGSAGSGPTGPSFPIVPVTLGVGCIAGGVALSKASARNKQKALDASAHFNLLRVPPMQFTALGTSCMPAFSLKLNLN